MVPEMLVHVSYVAQQAHGVVLQQEYPLGIIFI
jgi:hypothetical protein